MFYALSIFLVVKRTEVVNKIIDLIFETTDKPNCSVPYGIEVLLTLIEPKTTVM
jgi:hypothetical protein